MGCVVTSFKPGQNQHELITHSTLNTDKSSFFLDKRGLLWKMRKEKFTHEANSTYYNNLRIQSLPKNHYMLSPLKVERVDSKTVAIQMKRASVDLFDLLRFPFSIKRVLHGLHDIREAVTWLHAHGIAHRDIKPENIVVHRGRFKLVDFDFCFPLTDFVECGTEFFMCSKKYVKRWMVSHATMSQRMDVYAFGKLILAVFWQAMKHKTFEYDFDIWHMFHAPVLNASRHTNTFPFPEWIDVAILCCAAVPPDEIPPLPAAAVDTD